MPELPQVTISDSEFERSGWQPAQGWSGIVPSVSTYEEITARIGQPSDSYELLNAKCLEFFEGKIVLTFMHDAPRVIAKVRVLPSLSLVAKAGALDPVPTNLAEAKSTYGLLKLTKQDNLHGLIFERPGLRIACDTNPEPEPIKWIEFYRPGA